MAALAEVGQTGAWLIILVASIIAGLLFLPSAALMERFPGKSIIEVGEELVGPYFNGLLVIIFLIFCLSLPALALRQYAERVLTVSIPELPVSVAMAGMLVGSITGCYMGLEALARSSLFVLYFVGFTIILASLLTYPYWRFEHLFPLGGPGLGTIMKEGLFRSSLMYGVFFLSVIFPSLKNPEIRRTGLGAIGIGGLAITLTMLAMLLTFDVPVLQEMSLPSYEMSRLIYLGRFLQRVESVFVPIWALNGMLHVAVGIYAGCAIITRFLKLPYNRPFLLPVSVIIYSLAFIPTNISQVLWIDFHVVRYYAWIPAFLLPTVLYGIEKVKKKGKKNGGESNAQQG